MSELIDLKDVAGAVIYSLIGMVVFFVSMLLFDWLTPFKLWREIIEKQNMALAIVAAGILIGLALIISSAHSG